MRRSIRPVFLALALAHLSGCSSDAPSVSLSPSVAPSADGVKRPSVVYVADFYLDPAAIEQQPQKPGENLRGPGGRLKSLRNDLKGLRGEDPADEARELIGLLSETIAEDLKKTGYRAERLPSPTGLRTGSFPTDVVLPKDGWLVTGWFAKVVENQPAVEATVGFGTGAGLVSIEVEVSDLAVDPRTPFLAIGSHSGRHQKPGGLVTMNPYAMAVKFVRARGETEKDVKKQGAAIAQYLITYITGGGGEEAPPPAP